MEESTQRVRGMHAARVPGNTWYGPVVAEKPRWWKQSATSESGSNTAVSVAHSAVLGRTGEIGNSHTWQLSPKPSTLNPKPYHHTRGAP